MSVAGVDLGSSSCLIATAARGGVDVVLNEASARQNAAMVTFLKDQRHIGAAAESVVRSHYYDTAMNLKNIIGRRFDEPDIPLQASFSGAELAPLPDGTVGVKVSVDGTETLLRPEQIVASILSHLMGIAEAGNNGAKPRFVAIGIPAFYTDAQRRALLHACTIADVNCTRLIHESTAIALEYGIFRSARKEFPEDRDFRVLFLDMGASAFTASVVAFRNGELRVLASCSDRTLGSRMFDRAIAQKICAEFKAKYPQLSGDPAEDKKIFFKVMGAAEKAKKTISPHGVEEAAVYIEFLMDDFDYSGRLTREELETLTKDLVARIDAPILQALSEAGIASPAELDAVEMVGGGSRVRAVKNRFQQVLGAEVRITTTMNADESVTRGAALGCALLAPVFRSMPFSIKDVYPYPVQLHLDGDAGAVEEDKEGKDEDDEEEEGKAVAPSTAKVQALFDRGFTVGSWRKLVLRRQTSFNVAAAYAPAASSAAGGGLPANASTDVANFSVAGVPQDAPASKIKVFLGTDVSGVVKVRNAWLLEPVAADEAATAAGAPTDGPAEGPAADAPADAPVDEAAPGAKGEEPMDVEGEGKADEAAAADAAPKKRKYRRRELPVTTVSPGMDDEAVHAAMALEERLAAQDAELRLTAQVRNDLESYIYAKRDAILEDLRPYITDAEKEAFSQKLTAMEDWLYSDEGYEGTKDTFLGKLGELKTLGDPVEARVWEAANRGKAFEELKTIVESYLAVANSSEDRYTHLSDEDRATMRAEAQEAQAWMYTQQEAQGSKAQNEDPAVAVAELKKRGQQVRKVCQPIASKPKPAPAAPAAKEEAPADKETPMDEAEPEAAPSAEAETEAPAEAEGKEKESAEEDMDVDKE